MCRVELIVLDSDLIFFFIVYKKKVFDNLGELVGDCRRDVMRSQKVFFIFVFYGRGFKMFDLVTLYRVLVILEKFDIYCI